ncbi:MAG TPA: 2-hydroxyacid dehydrogenase [Clostridiales bacterium]|nr:2-hydroxyacid dehydrogenase [Clostridiales bacterium]
MMETENNGPEALEANENIIKHVHDADILIVHMTIVNKKLIDAAKNLKLLGIMRGGCDNANVDYAKEKGIKVVNSGARSSDAVADFTVGMIISEMKNIARSFCELKKGNWVSGYSNFEYAHDLSKNTIGIIGFGIIGQRVAARLKSFGSKIIVYDPYVGDDGIKEKGYLPVSLDKLLTSSDVISIHMRLSTDTKKMIGKNEFDKMKKNAFFINTARAGLVDEDALYNALKGCKIAGAAIDVFNVEPLPKDHRLIQLDNITITPHIAGKTCDTSTNSAELIAIELKRFLDNK